MSFKCTHYYNFHSLADMQRLFINLLVKNNLMKYRMLQPIMRSEKPYQSVTTSASVWSRIIKLNDSGNGIMHKRYNIYIYICVCVCV